MKDLICTRCGKAVDSEVSYKRYYKVCYDCVKKRDDCNRFKRHYGIVLDEKTMFDGYSPIQWYRWTTIERLPNGKLLTNIPSKVLTVENISKIGRYVIQEVMGLKNRADICRLSQKMMIKHKIQFSRTSFIKGSPYNLISLSFPELKIKGWELIHAPCNFWKDYNNFTDAVKHYYNVILNDDQREIPSVSFSTEYIKSLFFKLGRAKESYYSNKTWTSILSDIGVAYDYDFEILSADGIKMSSRQETSVYDYIKYALGITDISYIGKNRSLDYGFSSRGMVFYPDYRIDTLDGAELIKPVIIEYYGLYDNLVGRKNKTKFNDIKKEYIKKTNLKNKYYNENKDIIFVGLYPEDLKNKMDSIKEKMIKALEKTEKRCGVD